MLGARAQKLLTAGTAVVAGAGVCLPSEYAAVGGGCELPPVDVVACARRKNRRRHAKHRGYHKKGGRGGGGRQGFSFHRTALQAEFDQIGAAGVVIDGMPVWMQKAPFASAAEASAAAAKVKDLFKKSPVEKMSKDEWYGFVDEIYQLVQDNYLAKNASSGSDSQAAMMQVLMKKWMDSNADHITTRKSGDLSQFLMKQMMLGNQKSTTDPVTALKLKLTGFTTEEALQLVNLFDQVMKKQKWFGKSNKEEKREKLNLALQAHHQDITRIASAMWNRVDNSVRKKLQGNMIKFRDATETFGWNHFDIPAGAMVVVADQTTGDDVHVTVYTICRSGSRSYAVGPSMHVLLSKDKAKLVDKVLELEDGDPPIAFKESNFATIAEKLREVKNRELMMKLCAGQAGGMDQNVLMMELLGSNDSDAQTVINCIKENPAKMLQALTSFSPDIMSGFVEEMMAKYQASMDANTRMLMEAVGGDMFDQKKTTVAEMITTSNLIGLAARAGSASDNKIDEMMMALFSENKDAFNAVRVKVKAKSTGCVLEGFWLQPSKAAATQIADQLK